MAEKESVLNKIQDFMAQNVAHLNLLTERLQKIEDMQTIKHSKVLSRGKQKKYLHQMTEDLANLRHNLIVFSQRVAEDDLMKREDVLQKFQEFDLAYKNREAEVKSCLKVIRKKQVGQAAKETLMVGLVALATFGFLQTSSKEATQAEPVKEPVKREYREGSEVFNDVYKLNFDWEKYSHLKATPEKPTFVDVKAELKERTPIPTPVIADVKDPIHIIPETEKDRYMQVTGMEVVRGTSVDDHGFASGKIGLGVSMAPKGRKENIAYQAETDEKRKSVDPSSRINRAPMDKILTSKAR